MRITIVGLSVKCSLLVFVVVRDENTNEIKTI